MRSSPLNTEYFPTTLRALAQRAARAILTSHVKILVAITGATGILYAQRLLDNLDPQEHEVHLVLSNYAHQVIAEELPDGLKL